MKKLRKLTLLTLALSLVLCLTGCDLFGGGVTKQDAVDYVKAQMDVIYKGEFQGYLDLVADSTEEECQEAYDSKMTAEAEYLMSCLAIEYPTEELTARFADLYRQIFAKADYTCLLYTSPRTLRMDTRRHTAATSSRCLAGSSK